jgi:hypothetical protein
VGNLPPSTQVVDLKDYFSREATEDIESVFFIPKSNCAFVNYKTETSCASAMSRFHDSRYQGVRLVCRLRRESTPLSANSSSGSAELHGQGFRPGLGKAGEFASGSDRGEGRRPEPAVDKVKEKYFIVKSLTVEDLELSAHNGTWATQAHNEMTLNKAYQVCPCVQLSLKHADDSSLLTLFTSFSQPTSLANTLDMPEWHLTFTTNKFQRLNSLRDRKRNNDHHPRS